MAWRAVWQSEGINFFGGRAGSPRGKKAKVRFELEPSPPSELDGGGGQSQAQDPAKRRVFFLVGPPRAVR